MAITQVGSATTGSSAGGTNFTVNKPTGVAVGDVLICTGSSNKGAWSTLPSGFQQIAVSTDASLSANFRSYIWYKIIDGTEGSTFTFGSTTASGSGAPMVACMTAWRGADVSGNPVSNSDFDQLNTYSTNPTISITTTVGTRILYCAAARKESASGATTMSFSTATSGWSEQADVSQFSGGSTMYACSMYSRNADDDPGTFTEPTVSLGGSGATQNGSTYFIVALKVFATTDASAGSLTVGPSTTANKPTPTVKVLPTVIG